jgi:hypothetical protein
MAVVYPLANGNWSSVANWYSGGIPYGQLPLSTDDVHADGKTVVIDQDITIATLTNGQRSGGINNGTFTCSTSRTLNIGVIISGSTSSSVCLILTSTGVTINLISTTINSLILGNQVLPLVAINGISGTINITATNIIGNGGNQNWAVGNTGTNNVNITANITSTGSQAISNTVGTMNINGTIYASPTNNMGTVLQNGASGITNITGALIGGTILIGICVNNSIGTVNIFSNQTMSGTTGIGVYSNNGTTNFGTVGSPITITGATSGAASNFYACYHAGNGNVNLYGNIVLQNYSFSTVNGLFRYGVTSGTMTINGNITGGTVANTIGLNIENTGTVTVNGNVTSGSHPNNTPAVSMNQAGTITVNGNTTSNSFPAIWSTVTTAKFNLLGNVINTAGVPAYNGSFNVKISPTNAQTFTFQNTSNVNRLIATSNISPGAPGIADVRFGTIYGSSSEYTGTLRVPNPNTVALGVLTDNTTGTMLMTPADFWNTLSSTLTTSGSIGERLKTASTVQSNGDQLASYIV